MNAVAASKVASANGSSTALAISYSIPRGSSPLGRDRVRDESFRDVDADHAGAAVGEEARVVPLTAADIEHAQPGDSRQHLEERRRVDEIAIDVVPGTRETSPVLGVVVPIAADFAMVHL